MQPCVSNYKNPEAGEADESIAIDGFKLHDGHVFATVIIDLEAGHILWIAHGKKKKAVLDFIEHAGKDWFDTVEAVACDMNSDYQEVFEEEFDHISQGSLRTISKG